MAKTCTICVHPQRLLIEKAIFAGRSLRDIEGQFGTGKTIVARHRPHIAESIVRNAEVQEFARTGTLLNDVKAGEHRAERLYAQAEQILVNAISNQDPRTALQAIRAVVAVMGEARGYLELRGELSGELGRDKTPPEVSIQILAPTAAGELPRVSFASDDEIKGFAEIGILQRPV